MFCHKRVSCCNAVNLSIMQGADAERRLGKATGIVASDSQVSYDERF
jgi:hypothetical protein